MENATLAVIFSFFIPGLGQLYAGRTLRGIIVFIVIAALAIILYRVTTFAVLIVLIPWAWNLIDAYLLALRNVPFLIKSP
ncbi:MAG: hypothetical protein FWH46_02910 [Methanimicrococcus sp.]|nr:hypothetical protein [Methanimicrococcus sp.]